MAGLTEREREIRTRRAELWNDMAPTVSKMGKGEALTAEERKGYIDRDAELIGLDEELKVNLSAQERTREEKKDAESRGITTDEAKSRDEQETEALRAYLRYGNAGLTPEHRTLLVPQGKPCEAAPETRLNPLSTLPAAPAAGSTLAGEGGYLVPQGFWHNLQIAMKAYGGTAPYFRQVTTSGGEPMPWPTQDPTGIVGSLLSENTQVSEVDFSFGQGMLSAWTFTSGLHLASIQIVNDSAFSVDQFIRDRVGEALGRARAQYAYSGTGSSQPQGVSTAINAKGAGSVGAGGYFSLTAATPVQQIGVSSTQTELVSGALAFVDVLKMITYVDPAYRDNGNCAWFMNDATLQAERSVSSTTGFPLWSPDITVGGTSSGRLYNYPVVIDNNIASLTASTTAGPIFGALDHAMVLRQVNQAGILRLVERYADFLQVGYIGYERWDARSNDLRAVTQAHAAAT
jgi:HK97 family phage major capsid protein